MDRLKRAAAHLPRVDAIGGSAAGVYVNNQVKVASLFRACTGGSVQETGQEPLPRDQTGLEAGSRSKWSTTAK